MLGAEGAVILLEKVSPAVRDVDSSSGALGSATCSAVASVVPIIAEAPATVTTRAKWLERLFAAIQEDDPPYIESLGDPWGELCATPELASRWADELVPHVRRALAGDRRAGFHWLTGTVPCYSALFKAGRHDELLGLLALDRHPIWPCLIWGGRVLAARGQVDEAIAYVKERAGINTPRVAVARFAEGVLLHAGRRCEAYEHHAIEANQGNSRLATYRALAKKYPEIEPDRLLGDLIASTPDDEGKWFATAKTLKRLDLAMKLAWRSPCDPKTLTRAARDYLNDEPAFATEVALAALHWISEGHGYDLTGQDVQDPYRYAHEGARMVGHEERVALRLRPILTGDGPARRWMRQVLGLSNSAPPPMAAL